MRGKPEIIYRMLLILCLVWHVAWLDPFHDMVDEGNNAYEQGQYDRADRSYEKAERYAAGDEDRARVAFNRGDAAYRKGDYETAERLFSEAASSADRSFRARALYNRGNTRVKAGRYADALNDYRDSLGLDPANDRVRKNIEYLTRMMDNNGGQGDGNDRKKDGGEGNAADRKGDRNESMSPEQRRNIMESMKNKPVRRQRGDGNGRRYLEKNW